MSKDFSVLAVLLLLILANIACLDYSINSQPSLDETKQLVIFLQTIFMLLCIYGALSIIKKIWQNSRANSQRFTIQRKFFKPKIQIQHKL
jgi:hypothetical protein